MLGNDPTKRIPLDDFRFDPDGGLIYQGSSIYIRAPAEEIIADVGRAVTSRKVGLFRKYGALTADDAMFVALRIRREHPTIAAAVAERFDELLLDAAQDTSELQLWCLAELRKTGKLKSLVMIGDLEQSIFSFQGARAELVAKIAHGAVTSQDVV